MKKVSYAMSTYEKAKKFNDKLNELQKTIKPIIIRTYLEIENKKQEINLNLSENEKAQIEELKKIRMSGIQAEMKYALAQAEKNGIELEEEIVAGKSIVPGFSRELLEKVPSLGVYNLFMLFTEEELEELKKDNKK